MVSLVAVADENAAERQPREVELGADDQFEALRVAVDAEIIDARTIIALVVDGPHERLIRRHDLIAGLDGGDPDGAVAVVVVDATTAGRPHVVEVEIRSEEHTSELQSLMRISYA